MSRLAMQLQVIYPLYCHLLDIRMLNAKFKDALVVPRKPTDTRPLSLSTIAGKKLTLAIGEPVQEVRQNTALSRGAASVIGT